MKRNAYAMRLKPGYAGVSDYSIYLDEKTNTLFAFQYLADDATDSELANEDIVKKWWPMMRDVMDTNADESPVSDPPREMFHMD